MARRWRASSARAVRVQVCVQILRLRCRPAPLPAPAAPSLAAPSLAALAAACGAARLDALRLEALVAVARPFGLDHHCPLLGARNRDRYARGDGGGAGRGGAGGEADLQRAAVEGDAVVLLDGLEGVCLFGVDDKREALGAAVVLCLQLDSLALANLLQSGEGARASGPQQASGPGGIARVDARRPVSDMSRKRPAAHPSASASRPGRFSEGSREILGRCLVAAGRRPPRVSPSPPHQTSLQMGRQPPPHDRAVYRHCPLPPRPGRERKPSPPRRGRASRGGGTRRGGGGVGGTYARVWGGRRG
mmetsp:Transcript_20221/g.66927  ORF Transcript_20221/g.66927 Transcript_20221/m.66927 type:complete len:304 (+) Transcript_20221:281-1192(+)